MYAPVIGQTTRFARKQEAILEVAARLFNARGLGGTAIADVARGVGLNTASVTYYYRKKEDLAAACFLRAIEAMDRLIDQATGAATPTDRLTRFIELYFASLAAIAEGRAPPLINFWDLRALTGPQGRAATLALVAVFRRIRELLVDPAGPAFSRPVQNARTWLVLAAVIAAKRWSNRYEAEDYPRAAARMSDILVGGLAGYRSVWAPPQLCVASPQLDDSGGASRSAFLRAATELINEYGYRGTSVDRISAKLNVTKGSFYHHNETKDELVLACFHHTFEVMRRAHRDSFALATDGWSRLCALSVALARYQLSEYGPLLRLSALSATVEALRPGLLAELARLSEKTAGLIADGIADGSVRATDPMIAAELVNGMINAAGELTQWCSVANAETVAGLFAKPAMLGLFSAT